MLKENRDATRRKWGAALLVLTFSLAGGRARAQDAEGCRDNPLITRYPGATISQCWNVSFDRFLLPLGPVIAENKLAKSKAIEGKIARIKYVAPDGVSPLAVWENYKDAIRGAGFTTLFQCRSGACQNGDWDVNLFQSHEDPWDNYGGYQYQLSARRDGPDGAIYVSLHLTNKPVQVTLDIVEPRAMRTGLIRVDAAAMAAALERSGHIALYGIYFDTGKATLKPASTATLKEIVKLLRQRPALKLYVVGDTDDQGGFVSNMALSKRRAAAVVAALSGEFGVAARRLRAVGVGPVDPVSTNRTAAGRKQNRRVELVEQ